MTYWPLPMERPRIKSTQRPRIGRPQWLDPYPGATWNMRRSGKTSVFFRFRWGDFLSPTAKLRVLKDDFWRRFGWSVLEKFMSLTPQNHQQHGQPAVFSAFRSSYSITNLTWVCMTVSVIMSGKTTYLSFI